MAKSIRQVTSMIIDDLRANLNSFIASTQMDGEDWFTELEIVERSPRNEEPFMLGVYLSSPDNDVFQGTAQGATIKLALDCVLDDDYEDCNLPQLYLSAVVEFLRKRGQKYHSVTSLAQITRVDVDGEVNAFTTLVEVSVTDTDYDFS